MAGHHPQRTIWILSCGRVGDLKQMQALAQTLGWPTEIQTLATGKKRLLGGPQVTAEARARLKGPLPSMLLCAERAAAETAIDLKRQNPRLKIVCLARPRGHFDVFDLIITTPQYRLAAAPNVLEVTLPLTSPPATPATGKGHGLALLVGGSSPPYVIDGPVAAEMAARVRQYAAAHALRIAGTTSARTGKAAAQVLAREFDDSPGFHLWEQGKPNPYADLLSGSAEIIVTEDSVSMVADALAAGKPVSIYPLPEKWGPGHRLVRNLWRLARRRDGGLMARLLWPLFDSGLLEARADRKALHEALIARGITAWFGEERLQPDASLFAREMQAATARVRALFDRDYS